MPPRRRPVPCPPPPCALPTPTSRPRTVALYGRYVARRSSCCYTTSLSLARLDTEAASPAPIVSIHQPAPPTPSRRPRHPIGHSTPRGTSRAPPAHRSCRLVCSIPLMGPRLLRLPRSVTTAHTPAPHSPETTRPTHGPHSLATTSVLAALAISPTRFSHLTPTPTHHDSP